MATDGSRTPLTHGIARYVVFPAMLLVAVASLLPLVETNVWFIRLLDFARLQFLVLLLVLLVLYWALRRPRNALGWLSVLLVGTFAVPWELVVRRVMRIGGLVDPRVGRGFHPTFHAGRSLVLWPLDQVLYQERFALAGIEALPAFGSDHHPVLVGLYHLPAAAARQEAPEVAPDNLRQARTSIEAARRELARTRSG